MTDLYFPPKLLNWWQVQLPRGCYWVVKEWGKGAEQSWRQRQRMFLRMVGEYGPRVSMVATLSFLLKIPITAISLYWRNDTPAFVTWRSSSPNQFVPEIVSPLPCSPGLVGHVLLRVYFFNELISFISSFDKCHTSVFNALIFDGQLLFFLVI